MVNNGRALGKGDRKDGCQLVMSAGGSSGYCGLRRVRAGGAAGQQLLQGKD